MESLLSAVIAAIKRALDTREVNFRITKRFAWTGYKMKWHYFQDAEVEGLDQELVAMLDLSRAKAGIPFRITSGFRTQSHNDSLPNAVKDSSHLTGNGVDLECADSIYRFKMLKALLDVGFTRIGVYEKHLHCDNRKDLPQNVIWYSKGT